MNCQPSFRTGSIPVVGPALDDFGGPAFGGRQAGGEPRRRVPDRDIIDVGVSRPAARTDDPVDVADLAIAPARGATGLPVDPPTRRSYTKALLTLLILQIAVAGGLHLRKRFAEAHVIVVPATTDEGTVIT
jgi:hypothetical protein